MASNFIYIIILIIAVFIFLIIPVGFIAKMVFNKTDDSISADDLLEIEEQIRAVLLELQSVVDKNMNLLDSKVDELGGLIAEADKKIHQMKTLSLHETSKGEREAIPALASVAQKPVTQEGNNIKNTDVTEMIEDMALSGIKIEEIAKKLNMHSGEVQLILGLRGLKGNKIQNSKRQQSSS